MAKLTDPRQRGILKTILGKPFNAKTFSKNSLGPQVGGIARKKFTPNAQVSKSPIRKPRTRIPKLPNVAPDQGFTSYNSTTKRTVRFNADGTRARKARPSGRRYVPAGPGGRGTRVIQEK